MSGLLTCDWRFSLKYKHRQSGSCLIEILIAIVISVFILLALAAAQLTTLRNQTVAHDRTLATVLSGELIERMRANRDGALNGKYSPALQNYPGQSANRLTNGAAPGCADAIICTSSEVAAMDLYEWRASLARAVVGGWGEISGSAQQGFVVRVYFKESDNEDGVTAHADDADLSKSNCRMAVLAATTDKDVRCLATIFSL
ncbi:type IV pilus modification protein PilV [Glaciimonas soli]|uniref:Type IV pilus modification protein PilV n=1 Tax=Glaciimonas soli TaxID=2590999 RepID=A0A843YWZ4_9BURK|nr:type IV pilus modification protein PilV [Glaciimonas soli]MQR01076.1 type IV pilus modification protein PilV [Glaciimonas soli]